MSRAQMEYEKIGQLYVEICQDKLKLRDLGDKLKDRAAEFSRLAELADPDTGGFAPESNDSVFWKSPRDKNPKKEQFFIPKNVGELISEHARLEKNIRDNKKELDRLTS